jgi:hypothetical protein
MSLGHVHEHPMQMIVEAIIHRSGLRSSQIFCLNLREFV